MCNLHQKQYKKETKKKNVSLRIMSQDFLCSNTKGCSEYWQYQYYHLQWLKQSPVQIVQDNSEERFLEFSSAKSHPKKLYQQIVVGFQTLIQ